MVLMKACSEQKKQLEYKKNGIIPSNIWKKIFTFFNNSSWQPIESPFYASGDEKSKCELQKMKLNGFENKIENKTLFC